MGGVEVNFYDTSEYMFRNSSTRKGGFEGNIGYTDTDTDLDVRGSEDVERTQELLLEADRTQLRSNISSLEACAVNSFCTDKGDLVTRAGVAWERAINLYPTFKALLDDELADLKVEMLNQIYMMQNQWSRTAGSSLNCLVQEMRVEAEVAMTRRVAGVVADTLRRFKEHETGAIQQAFEMQFNARARVAEIGLSSLGQFWNILRGSNVVDVTDRDYTENRDEDAHTINALGKFYHEGIDIADNAGEYSTVTDSISASQAVSLIVGQ